MPAYGFRPPPPPPPTAGNGRSYRQPNPSPYHSQQGQQGGHGQHQGYGRGGGAPSRGRGGFTAPQGRPEYHNPPPVHYEYAGQQPYAAHAHAPAPAPAPLGGSHPGHQYPPSQPHWPPEHGHGPPSHTPAPLSTSNYHPNYAPQPYHPTQYPQQPAYGPPQQQQQQFGQPYQAPPPTQVPPQWSAQPPPLQSSPYGGARSRGGYHDRSAPRSHGVPQHMHPPYEHDRAPPVNGNYAQPYPPDPRTSHYSPAYPYGGPPAPPQDAYYGQPHHRRSRGGGHRDGRGRGGHHAGEKRNHNKTHQHENNHKSEPPSVGKKKKRKTNTLGLTPGVESESEDDEGEETVLTELIGTEAFTIKDVAAYLADRKKNFPTKARVEAKKAAKQAQKDEDKASTLEKEADRLRKQLRKVEFSIKRKREQGDEGDEMRTSLSEDSSEDDKPEVMSAKSPVALPPPPPPAKKADVSRHCKYYSTGGTCGKKGKCRFVHDPEVREAAMKDREANNGRLTIQQRLVLNDKEQDDLAVLQSIQYLRGKGLMGPPETPKEGEQGRGVTVKKEPVPTAKETSLLPAASASLPPPPVKREPGLPRRNNPPPSIIPGANSISNQGLKHYQGWLLEPYGSSGGKRSSVDDLP